MRVDTCFDITRQPVHRHGSRNDVLRRTVSHLQAAKCALPHVREGPSPLGVEEFGAEPASEALDVAVLGRLPRLSEGQLDAVIVGPLIERATAQFRSVVDDQTRGPPRSSAIISRIVMTRAAGRLVPPSHASPSRLSASATLKIRNGRPVVASSVVKSAAQHSLTRVGATTGGRASATRLRGRRPALHPFPIGL
jgi:hypothetical protein